MKKPYELLAPAGGIDHLRAAVENGADAVYLGGKLFNARINAGNFTDEELEYAVDYAHVRNVKIYVTMNTLLMDQELDEAYAYAEKLYIMGVDALIIQDLGLAAMIKSGLPDFPLHLSTQGTVYNKEGVAAAKKLGFERVVLAREVSIKEMKEASKLGIELEVFVHGALCLCYSGQCQMSRLRGGRSGNRGQCAQPCRLPYFRNGKEGGSGEYILSTKDMCTIDSLGDILSAGVISLKIEGRMKSPEYVAIVTSIYRKYIDMYIEKGVYTVAPSDRKILEQVFNRGGFTEGYLYGNPGKNLMSGELSKHQGVYIGKVVKRGERDLVDVELEPGEKLLLGDGIEIRNREMPGNVVTYIKEKGQILSIGDIKGTVNRGDFVYKITDKLLMKEAEKTYELSGDGKEKNGRKVPIAMRFAGHLGDTATLEIIENSLSTGEKYDKVIVSVRGESIIEEAINKPLTVERIEEQLSKNGDVPYVVANIEVDIDKNISIPMSALNQLRRSAFETLTTQKKSVGKREIIRKTGVAESRGIIVNGEANQVAAEPLSKGEENGILTLYIHKWTDSTKEDIKDVAGDMSALNLDDGRLKSLELLVPIKSLMLNKKAIEEAKRYIEWELRWNEDEVTVIPYISNGSKGEEDKYVRDNFQEILEICRHSGIVVGNMGWIEPFKEEGIAVQGGYGLNITNRESEKVFLEMGACGSKRSMELCDIEDGRGNLPVMVTEHLLKEGEVKDFKGSEYRLILSEYGDKTIITRKETLGMEKIKDEIARGNVVAFL